MEQAKVENVRLENELSSQPGALTAIQIQELLQMVSDEKEARESLQNFASRLNGEMDNLKHSHSSQASPSNGSTLFWIFLICFWNV